LVLCLQQFFRVSFSVVPHGWGMANPAGKTGRVPIATGVWGRGSLSTKVVTCGSFRTTVVTKKYTTPSAAPGQAIDTPHECPVLLGPHTEVRPDGSKMA
jgi:hypothetical protein